MDQKRWNKQLATLMLSGYWFDNACMISQCMSTVNVPYWLTLVRLL